MDLQTSTCISTGRILALTQPVHLNADADEYCPMKMAALVLNASTSNKALMSPAVARKGSFSWGWPLRL
eukprot:37463-Alexandrium_andersonii.AAC.1